MGGQEGKTVFLLSVLVNNDRQKWGPISHVVYFYTPRIVLAEPDMGLELGPRKV